MLQPTIETNVPGLPDGVRVVTLNPHPDHRGRFTEVFRQEWDTGIDPLQWNVVHNEASVLRGVHVHRWHLDYLTMISGSMTLALHDIRPSSATRGLSATLEVDATGFQAVMIPPGVCHGFWFAEPSIYVYAVSRYWDLADELGCPWDAPELALDWNVVNPVLSERDRTAGDYDSMVAAWLGANDGEGTNE